MRRVHLLLTLVWVGLAVPSLLWWSKSIAWLVFMSVYAIVATHWDAFQTARAEEAAR